MARPVGYCPWDGCPLRAFARRPATFGYAIELHGCRYCHFNWVIAVARDMYGNSRPFAEWSFSTNAGVYLLGREAWPIPPGWLDLAAAALPTPDATA